jgi:hypothetical protein
MLQFPKILFLLIPMTLISVAGLLGEENGLSRDILIPEQRLVLSIGEREVLNDGRSLDLAFFPDQMPVVLDREPNLRVLMAAWNRTYLMEGADWRTLASAREVLAPDPENEYDNGYAGIAGVHRTPDGRIYAIYHAEDHVGMPVFASGQSGYYASVAMAFSDDDGISWQKFGPVIQSKQPKTWARYPGQADRGTGEPSLVLDPSGDWLYAYYTEHSRATTVGVYISMARASTKIRDPSSFEFFKYHDREFSGPGLRGSDSPIIQLTTGRTTEALLPHVVFVPSLKRYVMTLSVNNWNDYLTDQGLTNSGAYIAFSRDGVNWSAPTLVHRDFVVPLTRESLCWGSTIVFDGADALTGWFLYGFSPHWALWQSSGTPHHLAGHRVRFGKRGFHRRPSGRRGAPRAQ